MSVASRQEQLIRAVEAQVPRTPGVYVFRDGSGRVVYIGKSVNLRRRMREHLRSDPGSPRSQIRRMAFEIEDFSFVETESELHALLLEALDEGRDT